MKNFISQRVVAAHDSSYRYIPQRKISKCTCLQPLPLKLPLYNTVTKVAYGQNGTCVRRVPITEFDAVCLVSFMIHNVVHQISHETGDAENSPYDHTLTTNDPMHN